MIEKNKKSQDYCCQEESLDEVESCDCQGICTCDDFIYDEDFDCDDCCDE